MAALIRIAAIVVFLSATPAHANETDRWRPLVAEASARFGIPAAWIERVIAAESGGRTTIGGRPIRSRAGAIGLMQLMPGTWAEMRARLGLDSNPDDPRGNILAGTFYLRLMYERFGYPGLFAAYNAGPARYAAYLAGKQSLPAETMAYLAAVDGPSLSASPPPPVPVAELLFALRRGDSPATDAAAAERSSSSLFAIRKVLP
jgi:soluble lytic murein transglycosylase-like protein